MFKGPCPYCGCIDIDEDPSRGDAVCTECGAVLEENCIVSEVQYQEDSHGNSRAIGKLVGPDGFAYSSLNASQFGLGRNSREVTLLNARKKISILCSQLKMPSRCVEIALNFYKLALLNKLTKGRKNSHVIAACVYMTCRKEETSHMLLDLSDILQVNVYELGRTYTRLSAALNIQSPLVDPSIYCMRFANQLQLGDKTHAVFMTASRIVQRMKRDWMHTGRRPAGLCGAALLVAARRHNFSRSVKDIIKIVKVCSATVRKRLSEFGETPSCKLTLDEFMNIDLEEEQDPPAFRNIRKRKLKELEESNEEVNLQVKGFRNEIEKALEEARKKKLRGKYDLFTPTHCSDNDKSPDEFVLEETLRTINEDLLASVGSSQKCVSDEQLNNILLPDACHKFLNQAFVNPEKNEEGEYEEPSLASIGIKETAEGIIDAVEGEIEQAVELDLAGLDDTELDTYIMTDGEAKKKIEMWIKSNITYLREHTEKEERRAKEEEENANKPDHKKRRRRLKRIPVQASTTGEAIEQMVQQKRISNKLDYDVLRRLGCSTITSDNTEKESNAEDDNKTSKKSVRPKINKSPCNSVVPQHLKERLSAFIPSPKWKDSSLPFDDDQETEMNNWAEEPDSTIISSPSAVPETTTVMDETVEPQPDPACADRYVVSYNDVILEHIQHEEEDEEDNVNDGHLSITQLLSQHRGETEVEDEEDDYDYDDDYDDC